MADPIVIKTLKVIDKKNNNQEYKLTIEGLAPAAPYLTQAAADAIYLTQANASTVYLTKEEASTTYQHIGGTDEQGQSVDLSDYLKKAEASKTYATKNHTHSFTFAQIADKPGSYTPSTHTHNITDIYVNGSSLTASTYVASGSITASIENNTTLSLIPTVGAVISYINSLDGDNVEFGGQS